VVNWVISDAELASAVRQWGDVIALDTEFIRTDTFYPMPGLYQVATEDEVYLLDPLEISDWEPFIEVLRSTEIVKVMHACQEDLELLFHHLGVEPQALFDTQFANAFVTADFSLSYAGLVNSMLDVALDKHETRSNWLARPLSDEQVTYAQQDVIYLIPLYRRLRAELERLERYDWYQFDMQLRGVYQPGEPAEYYRGVKKAWQLKGEQLAVLRRLCAWREQRAREENVPRNRIVWDDHLYEFAKKAQLDTTQVSQALPRGVARRYAQDLSDQHAEGKLEAQPQPLPPPLSSAQGALVKRLKVVAAEAAGQLGFAQELLARRRDLEECVRHYAAQSELSGHYTQWREPIVGEQFRALLRT